VVQLEYIIELVKRHTEVVSLQKSHFCVIWQAIVVDDFVLRALSKPVHLFSDIEEGKNKKNI
jgi:hypothetical protein